MKIKLVTLIAILFDDFNLIMMAIRTKTTFHKPRPNTLWVIKMLAIQFCIAKML
jgi:hypothetical protein